MFVLIHSPLVGPLTWSLVAVQLQQRGIPALVPALRDSEREGPPYWLQHAQAIARSIEHAPYDRPPILVAHSGAGMLLPAARQAIGRPVAAYIFVDAGIPEDGKSRLDLFDSPAEVARFRRAAVNGLLPVWRDADLTSVIPDAEIRQPFVAELRPLAIAVYEEALPVFAGWPDAPCGYLRFGSNPAYTLPAEHARSERWAYTQLAGEHFHMLVDPPAVTGALLGLAGQLGIAMDRSYH